jgi:HEAT repeat protein
MGIFGPPNIEKLLEKGDVKALIGALSYADIKIRIQAVIALGKLRDIRAAKPILGLLWENDEKLREACVKSAAMIGPVIIPMVLDGLALESPFPRSKEQKKDEEIFWRCKMIQILGLVGDSRAHGQLIHALNHTSPLVRIAAIEALARIQDVSACDELKKRLKDKDIKVKVAAVDALGSLDTSSIQDLLDELKNFNSSSVNLVLTKAIEKLGWKPGQDEISAWYWIAKCSWDACMRIGTPAVIPLLAVLQKGNDSDRRAAAKRLGELGDARAIKPLAESLRNGSKELRPVVQNALVVIGAQAVENLIAVVKDGSKEARLSAVEALGQIGDRRALPVVESLANETDPGACAIIYKALDALNWQPNDSPQNAWYWVNKRDWQHCLAVGPAVVVPLLGLLHSSSGSDKIRILEMLGELGDTRVIDPFLEMLKSEQYISVHIPLVQALANFKYPRVIASLVEMSQTSSINLRIAVADALKKLDWEPDMDEDSARYWAIQKQWEKCRQIGALAVRPLIDMFRAPEQETQLAALATVVSIGPSAVQVLLETLKEPHIGLRVRSAQALNQLGQPTKVEEEALKYWCEASQVIIEFYNTILATSFSGNEWESNSENGRRIYSAGMDWAVAVEWANKSADILVWHLWQFATNLNSFNPDLVFKFLKAADGYLHEFGDHRFADPIVEIMKKAYARGDRYMAARCGILCDHSSGPVAQKGSEWAKSKGLIQDLSLHKLFS